MAQFPRTVYCHLQAVLLYVGVTDQRRARERKDVYGEKSSNIIFKVFNEKCAIYIVRYVRSKTWGRRKIAEYSGMRCYLFNKIIVSWSIECEKTVPRMCVKTYANKQSAAGSSQIIWFQHRYSWGTHYMSTEPTEISPVNRPSSHLLHLITHFSYTITGSDNHKKNVSSDERFGLTATGQLDWRRTQQ
jgi:hypothetical protein